jgi:hypothetical protein
MPKKCQKNTFFALKKGGGFMGDKIDLWGNFGEKWVINGENRD